MPQTPILVGLLNSTRALPDADLPVDPTFLVEVQNPAPVRGVDPPRSKVSIADIIGGGGGVAGSGTATHVALWSNGTTIGDSIITDDGTTALVTGNGHVTGTFLADGATTIDDTLHVTGAITADAGFNAAFIGGSIDPALTAVGTNRGNALALTKQTNIVTVAASSAVGVVLPAAATVGVGNWVDVYNDGPSNSFHVYAAGSDTIDTIAGSTGVPLTNAFWARYIVTAAGAFKSYRTPVVRSA
jgi:hypothetical protein